VTEHEWGDAATVVTVAVHPVAGHEAKVLAALQRASRDSLGEPGCLRYDVLTSAAEPAAGVVQAFALVEVWSDRALLRKHATGPVFARLTADLEGLLKTPLAPEVWHPASTV
jgi:quinol monooxygenase YgiN